MSNSIVNTFDPGPEGFDVGELCEALSKARNEAMDEGEPFPFLFTVDGRTVTTLTLERVHHTDGSSNIEARLHFGE